MGSGNRLVKFFRVRMAAQSVNRLEQQKRKVSHWYQEHIRTRREGVEGDMIQEEASQGADLRTIAASIAPANEPHSRFDPNPSDLSGVPRMYFAYACWI